MIFITGSSGLIGSSTADFFLKKRIKVIGIDNDLRSYFFGKNSSTRWREKSLKESKFYKHYNIECADHAMSMLRAGGKFDGNRGGITDRPDLKVFWQTFQKGKDPLNRLQTSQDVSFGGQPRRATEHILRINEKVSVVGILEKDIDTNQYILLPNKKSEEKGKIINEKVGGITNLSRISPLLKELNDKKNNGGDIGNKEDNIIMLSMSDIVSGKHLV